MDYTQGMYKISPILAFKDNYIWAISNERTQDVAVVDPGVAAPVLAHLQENGLKLCAILLTHKHSDHIGGVVELINTINVPVYGPRSKELPMVTTAVGEGDVVDLETLECTLKVMEIPAHTLEHIAYFNNVTLFCGDTLFTGGCGRIFEGTPLQMYTALQRLAALDPDTLVYCGHEYTLNNLNFAENVEPDNSDIQMRLCTAQEMRTKQIPTVPCSIGLELLTNPFLRCTKPTIIKAAEQYKQTALEDPIDVLAALRAWKNNF